jgi:hypothetical protein
MSKQEPIYMYGKQAAGDTEGDEEFRVKVYYESRHVNRQRREQERDKPKHAGPSQSGKHVEWEFF